MFLNRIVIENIRCLDRCDMDFTSDDGGVRRWTVLLGQNGIGKSSVLRAIAMMLCGSEALPDLLGPNPDSWIHQGRDNALIRVELRTAEKQPRAVELRLARGRTVTDTLIANRDGMQDLDRAINNRGKVRNFMTIGYGASRRISGAKFASDAQGTSPFSHPRARNVGSLFSADAALASVSAWAKDLHYRHAKRGLRQISQVFDDVLPGVEFDTIDRESGDMIFKTPDGRIPLRDLSDGYQSMIGWCGDLLYRIGQTIKVTDFAKPLNLRGLLIIDEIDLHLHPVWQRQLRDFLTRKFPQFQIVGTTHSPLTAHQAGAGELFVLRRPHPLAPPVLHQFPGAPNKLLIQQLLVSPLFEIETPVSLDVERKQKAYKRTKAKGTRKAAAASRGGRHGITPVGAAAKAAKTPKGRTLEEELADVPAWTSETPMEQRQMKVLRNLEKALGLKTAGNGRNG